MASQGSRSLPYRLLRRSLLLCSSIGLALDPKYLFVRFTSGSALKSVNGNSMRLDLRRDVGISKDLFMFGKREHLSTDYLLTQNVIGPGDTVLDLGANIGYYALLESKLVGGTGRVYAIEPVSSNYEMLQGNIKLNGITNIETFRAAAGKEKGEAEIFVASEGNISSLLYREGPNFVRKEKVPVVSVDDFVAERGIRPALIRMDVEGYEKEIIKGMRTTLSQKPKLLIEVHPRFISQAELDEMFATIRQSGYTDAIVISERNKLWMKRNGELKPSLVWVSGKIEGIQNALGAGSVKRISLNEVRSQLKHGTSAFHVLIS